MKREKMENIKDVVIEIDNGDTLRMSEEKSLREFIKKMPYDLKNEIFKDLEKENYKEDIKVSIDHLRAVDEIPTIDLSQESYDLIIEFLESRFDANIDYNTQIEEAIKRFIETHNC